MSKDRAEQTAKARRSVVENWMRMVLATGGIERFDDLHIDQIDPAWRDRESWVEGCSNALTLARELKETIAPEKTLVIMCGLTRDDREVAPPRSPTELAVQMDWTPPSIYLFDSDNEPWVDSGRVKVTLTASMFPASSECFVMDFNTEEHDEPRRTFVAVS
jgi:hypothetical protein